MSKWVESLDAEFRPLHYICSSCGQKVRWASPHCPNCGNRMELLHAKYKLSDGWHGGDIEEIPIRKNEGFI